MFAIRQTKQTQKKNMFTENQIASSHGKHESSNVLKSKKNMLTVSQIEQVRRQMFTENQIASSHYMLTINQRNRGPITFDR
jgi:hypothetical protein